jgi:3',5'-cyclic AMP phosphodiesterase CpdA
MEKFELNFAQVSDIHISHTGDDHDLLGSQSADFLADIVQRLNQIGDLDFVLISGDLVHNALPAEFDQFDEIISDLNIPYYVISGNHDRRNMDSSIGLTRHEFAQRFNPQIDQRPVDPTIQAGYWSRTIKPEVQLIGLDSIRDEDFGGVIDATQMSWLKRECEKHADKLIIVVVHHPLHWLAPIDDHPNWKNFVCENGQDVLTVLDDYPQIKLVLTAHHHLTKADMLGTRLHLACPAVATYPCAYRTIRLTKQSNRWLFEWRTHPAVDDDTIRRARLMMLEAWQLVFDRDFVELHADIALGSDYDRSGSVDLLNHS